MHRVSFQCSPVFTIFTFRVRFMLRDIKKTRTLLRQFRAFQCLKKRQRLRHRDRLDTLLIKTDKRIHNLTRALARTPDSPLSGDARATLVRLEALRAEILNLSAAIGPAPPRSPRRRPRKTKRNRSTPGQPPAPANH